MNQAKDIKSISEFTNNDKKKNSDIRNHILDYTHLNAIYEDYLIGRFLYVFYGIRKYGEFDFFRDLAIYLRGRYTNKKHMKSTYNNIIEIYYENY